VQIRLWAPGERPSETLEVANDGTERLTMLLQTRMKAVLLGLLVLGIAWMIFIQYAVVYRSYVRLEHLQAVDDVLRCIAAVRGQADHLETLANDWGAWDDMYRFAQDRNPEFKTMNLNATSMESADLDFLCVVDGSNSILWCCALDGMTRRPLTPEAFSQPSLADGHPLLALSRQSADPIRLLRTEAGLVLIATRPIQPSSRQGQPQGTVIMGRLFSDAHIEKLVQQTHVQFTAWNPSAQSLPSRVQEAVARSRSGQVLVEPADVEADELHAYTVLSDLFGQPTLAIEATIPRTIAAAGQEATLRACLWIGTMAVIVFAVVGGFLNRYMIWPILRLHHKITDLHRAGDLSARIPLQRNDEIGSLAEAFNTVLDGLTERRKEPRDHPAGGAHREDVRLAKTGV
jgi:sensor domain CHASE-containing protein